MPDSDAVILPVPLERPLYEALFQLSAMMGRSAEELASEAIAAAITLPTQLDLEALGTAMLADLQVLQGTLEPVHITEEDVAAMKRFLLPTDAAQLMLGAELISRLTDQAPDATPTKEASARLTAVATVCTLLNNALSEDEVRRWWTQPRYKLQGKAPTAFLGGGGRRRTSRSGWWRTWLRPMWR
ncbi:hypothetical protein ACFSC4_09780 [Deinococcus malanensis]|uniref:hypothetical protein n=1 Tax=Deinococcus malanensis TaxID=1706855 RepID=UPI00363225F0